MHWSRWHGCTWLHRLHWFRVDSVSGPSIVHALLDGLSFRERLTLHAGTAPRWLRNKSSGHRVGSASVRVYAPCVELSLRVTAAEWASPQPMASLVYHEAFSQEQTEAEASSAFVAPHCMTSRPLLR